MRLVCPNCDAEYEVDVSAIPDGGRDVQCSNCGHAWFQLPPAVEAELAAEEALFTAPPPEPAEPALPPVADPPAATGPRNIDDSVLAVLREEAEREVAQRRAEAPQGIETQPDLGLAPPGAPGGTATARRIARMKGIEPPPPPEPEKPVARRDLLPEIDEINSTLRATSEKRSGEAAAVAVGLPQPRRKTGFRNGFLLALIVAAIGLTAYAMAPRLSQQFPAAAPALSRYVATVDQARVWLDGRMQSLIDSIRGITGGDA